MPVPVDDQWRIDLTAVADADADRALVLWLNDPSNPTGVTATPEEMRASVEWARARGIVVASDECYAEFTYDDMGAPAPPVTALSAGTDGVLAVHSLSKRSNMAGLRAGFVAGDHDLVTYLGEVRKHGGLMIPRPSRPRRRPHSVTTSTCASNSCGTRAGAPLRSTRSRRAASCTTAVRRPSISG